jgi:diguanylate cyclase (GGDEF)-like protein
MLTSIAQRLVAHITLHVSRLARLDSLSRAALITLAVASVCSTAFAFDSANETTRATNIAANADDVNESFRAARYAVASEESLNRKYRLEPGKAVASEHQAIAASLVSAMLDVREFGDAPDRLVVDDVLRTQTIYLGATQKMYAAVDRGNTRLALALDRGVVDPAFRRIERAVEQRAEVHEVQSEAELASLRATQQKVIVGTIFFSLLEMACLGMFTIVLLTYQWRLKATHRAKIDKLENAALNDNLTGLGNHRAYQEDLEREISRAKRYGEPLTLALLDVDDFKVVNDRNGHMHGDSVLIKLAGMLGSLRLEDRAFRIGGDEFAVIFPHTPIDRATATMQRIRDAVQAEVFGCTVSVGLATVSGPECGVVTLQAQADAAMYTGKRAGRNGVTVFDESLGDMWLLSPAKIHNLHALIAAGSIPVAYQPIWDVSECRVLAYEALARPDAKYGFNGPQDAFDLAERIGCAHELDAVCRAGALASADELPSDALLFINVSPQSLDHCRLNVPEFVKAVRAAGLTPDRVVIEITERSITRVDAIFDSALELQNHGFRLALDDTGAGNSGLEMLSRLPLEFVKVDREVIVKALGDRNARGVLAGIIAIAESTGAYVIAEGIETKEMLEFVCRLGTQAISSRGVHGVQGYLLKRPSNTFLQASETIPIKVLLEDVAASAPLGSRDVSTLGLVGSAP